MGSGVIFRGLSRTSAAHARECPRKMTPDPMLQWLGMPVAASSHAGDVDRIMVLVHWLMAALFAGWGMFFVYVLFRFRRSRNPKASYLGARGRYASLVEGGVLAAEVILLAFFSKI